MRLCEPFSELDSGRIAESLGLNPSSYHSKHASSQSVDYSPLELPPDAFAEFEHCESFSFKCPNPKCDEKIDIRNAFLGQVNLMCFYIFCINRLLTLGFERLFVFERLPQVPRDIRATLRLFAFNSSHSTEHVHSQAFVGQICV